MKVSKVEIEVTKKGFTVKLHTRKGVLCSKAESKPDDGICLVKGTVDIDALEGIDENLRQLLTGFTFPEMVWALQEQ